MNDQVITEFSIAHTCRMSQFQTLRRSRGSPFNTQTLILAVYKQETKKFFC